MSVDSDRMLGLKSVPSASVGAASVGMRPGSERESTEEGESGKPIGSEAGEGQASGRSSRRRRRGKQQASSVAESEVKPELREPVAALPKKKQTEIYNLTPAGARDIGVEGVPVGRGTVAWVAGPGFVESVVQMRAIAESLKRLNCRFLRARAWWPGAKASDFERHLVSCLSVLRQVSTEFGLLAVSQIVHRSHLPLLLAHTDVIEVGPENSDDLELLRALGKAKTTVLLFRKPEMSFERFLTSVRALEEGGVCKIILGEAGVAGADPSAENVLDLASIITMRRETKYPVLVDMSAVARNASYVENLALAAVAAGADGLVTELRIEGVAQYGTRPASSLVPAQLGGLMKRADAFKHTMNALIHTPPHGVVGHG